MALDISDIRDLIEEHINQQPYEIKCDDCGVELEASDTTVHSDLDITVTVPVCSCAEKKIEEAEEKIRDLEAEVAALNQGD